MESAWGVTFHNDPSIHRDWRGLCPVTSASWTKLGNLKIIRGRQTTLFVNKVILEHSYIHSLICGYLSCFHATPAEWVLTTELMWSAKPTIFTTWPFTEKKFANPWSERLRSEWHTPHLQIWPLDRSIPAECLLQSSWNFPEERRMQPARVLFPQ